MRWQDWLVVGTLFCLWLGCWYVSDLFKAWRLKKIFSKLGFSFDIKNPTLKNQYYSDFELLGRKKIRFARNVCQLQLHDGIEITVFSIFTGIVRNPVFIFEVPGLNMPHFLLMPRMFYSRVRLLFRKDEIEIGSPIFSKYYFLFSQSQNLAKMSFNEKRIQMFERNQNIFMEGENRFLAITFSTLQLTPTNAESFLKNVVHIAKDFVESGSFPIDISSSLLN